MGLVTGGLVTGGVITGGLSYTALVTTYSGTAVLITTKTFGSAGHFVAPFSNVLNKLLSTMTTTDIHVGDVGTAFVAVVKDEAGEVIDLSAASLKQFVFQKPDATLLTASASFVTDGTDGQILYVSRAGDLDQSGTWRQQVHYQIGSEVKYLDVVKFKVFTNLPV